jgi:VWFA-related protein
LLFSEQRAACIHAIGELFFARAQTDCRFEISPQEHLFRIFNLELTWRKQVMSLPKAGILPAAAIAVAGLSVIMLAQEPPTYKVDVNVVNVLATVRDRSGRIVNDLSKDDFILEEDGKPQEIRYFSRQTELPLKIGLLIDTSMSQRNLIKDERSASYQFLNQVLRPDRDQAFVIKFAFEAELLQDLTNSYDSLQKALNALDVSNSRPRINRWADSDRLRASLVQGRPGGGRSGGGRGGWPGGQRRTGGGTVLYDSVFLASDEVLKTQEGRKAIILISDGVDNGSKVSEKDAIDAAYRADTIVYCIRYYDWTAYGGPFGRGRMGRDQGSKGAAALKDLSQETGGRMFEVSKKLPLKEIYDRIQEELRNQYYIGYTPSNAGGTEFRHIKLRTRDDKLQVVTRAGYYPRRS